MGTSAAPVFSDIELGSILVSSEHHETIPVEDDIVGISGYIIKELKKGIIVIFYSRSLLLDNLVATNKKFVINSSR